MALGLDNAYLLAIGLDLGVGISAVVVARRATPALAASTPSAPLEARTPALAGSQALTVPTGVIWMIALNSGFSTLALEVVWTRLLIALSLGAVCASWLSRVRLLSPA